MDYRTLFDHLRMGRTARATLEHLSANEKNRETIARVARTIADVWDRKTVTPRTVSEAAEMVIQE